MANTVPLMDPDRRWNMWAIDEIYDPDDSTNEGRYVPNPDDLVFSTIEGFYIVDSVDYSNGKSTLQPYRFPRHTGIDEGEELISIAPGRAVESYHAYIDTSVVPYIMAINKQLKIFGSTSKYMRAYRGTNIDTGEVVSRHYKTNGTLEGDKIPLEKLTNEAGNEYDAIKIPQIGNVSKKLDDGELLTLVFYDDQGHVVSLATVTVVNTSWIRRAHTSVKTVQSIELESTFLSTSENKTLAVPININMESVPLHGVVHYTNGEKKRLPIDGTKFKLMGIKRFISTILGQRQPVTLIYYLGSDEEAYETLTNEGGHIAESYTVTTTPVDGTYAVKLFTHPEWVSNSQGYRLKHHLYNLDRDTYYEVTDKVQIATNSPAFAPTNYGSQQEITFKIDLQEVDNNFNDYRHLQTTNIILDKTGEQNDPPHWRVIYDQSEPSFGGQVAEVEFVGSNNYKLWVDNDHGSKEAWLEEVYRKLLPIHNPTNEAQAPEPTHFVIQVSDWTQEYNIDMWNAEIQMSKQRTQGQLVYLHFLRRTAQKDLKLATAGLFVKRIDT